MNSATDANFTLPSALKAWLNDRRIEEVECVVSDIVGVGRGKTMPARKFFRAERMFLPSSIFYQTITGNYAEVGIRNAWTCLLYTSPSPRDGLLSRMPSSA